MSNGKLETRHDLFLETHSPIYPYGEAELSPPVKPIAVTLPTYPAPVSDAVIPTITNPQYTPQSVNLPPGSREGIISAPVLSPVSAKSPMTVVNDSALSGKETRHDLFLQSHPEYLGSGGTPKKVIAETPPLSPGAFSGQVADSKNLLDKFFEWLNRFLESILGEPEKPSVGGK